MTIRPYIFFCTLTIGYAALSAQNLDSLNTVRTKHQSFSPLKLESADELENQRVDNKDVMRATGNVQFSQDTISATCDEAAFFKESQAAILIGHVVLNDRHRTIFCEKARYYAKTKKAVCEGNVVFVDSSTTLVADSLVYYQNIEQLIAQGSVVIFDSLESVTIYGDKGFYDVRKKYAYATGHPYMIQYDSTKYQGQNIARISRGLPSRPALDASGKPKMYRSDDQLTVRGLFVQSFMDSHKVVIKDSVILTREKLTTTSDHAVYQTKKEVLELDSNPRAHYDLSNVRGDRITVQFDNREIKTIHIRGNALATSFADSIGKKTNRLTAKTISMNIIEKKLSLMFAEGNAYNLYYLDTKEGANEISGPSMVLFFDNNSKLKKFRVHGGTEGTYYPNQLENRVNPNIQQ